MIPAADGDTGLRSVKAGGFGDSGHCRGKRTRERVERYAPYPEAFPYAICKGGAAVRTRGKLQRSCKLDRLPVIAAEDRPPKAFKACHDPESLRDIRVRSLSGVCHINKIQTLLIRERGECVGLDPFPYAGHGRDHRPVIERDDVGLVKQGAYLLRRELFRYGVPVERVQGVQSRGDDLSVVELIVVGAGRLRKGIQTRELFKLFKLGGGARETESANAAHVPPEPRESVRHYRAVSAELTLFAYKLHVQTEARSVGDKPAVIGKCSDVRTFSGGAALVDDSDYPVDKAIQPYAGLEVRIGLFAEPVNNVGRVYHLSRPRTFAVDL